MEPQPPESLIEWERRALLETFADAGTAMKAAQQLISDMHRARVNALERLRSELGMTVPEISRATGLSVYRIRQLWRDHNRRIEAGLSESSPTAE